MEGINKDKIFGIRPYLKGLMLDRDVYNFGFRLAEHFNKPLQTKEEEEMESILLADKARGLINNLIEEIEQEDT